MNITLNNIEFEYNSNTKVLKGLNSIFETGKISVILGSSGSGKSTLLRCLANLESNYKGSILYNDKTFAELGYKGLNLSFVFQDYALYQGLTAKENILIALKHRKIDKIESKVDAICTMLDINNLLSKNVSQLSGGEQQRVAIARSLVLNPSILLMDEPFSNLDYSIKNKIRDSFLELQNELGFTTILVTHNQTEAADIGDKIFLMKDGKIEQEGKFETMYNSPSTPFVAEFLGNHRINKIKLDVEENNLIYIRPEHISLEKPLEEFYEINVEFIRYQPDLPNYIYIFKYNDLIIRMLNSSFQDFSNKSTVTLYIPISKTIKFS